jgi:nucleoside-diphosphate-sugar epimerase
MKILVTGATGFVGSAVVRALLRRGHDVTGLVRNLERGRSLERRGASLAVGDMRHPESYRSLVQQVDAVIHAAQEKPAGRWTRRKIDAMHSSDALMTRTLAGECLRRDKLLVYTSGALAHSGGVETWIDEAAPLRPCLLARGHAEMVRELTHLHRRRGLRMMVMTPGFVYGPGGLLQDTIERMRRRKYRLIGNGANIWSMVHVDDVGEAFALAVERGKSGVNYFLCDNDPLTRRAAMDRVSHALGLPPVGQAPNWLAGLMLGFPLVEAINASIRMRNYRARREIGWAPRYVSFAEGLSDAIEDLDGGGEAPTVRYEPRRPAGVEVAAPSI